MEGYCSAYIYWYLKRFYGMIGDNDERSPVGPGEIAKNGYILSHYAKYASNMTRIKIDANNPDLMATAYINPDESVITVVLLNFNNSGLNVQIASPDKIKSVDAVETTEIKNMQSITSQIDNEDSNVSILLSGKSIASVMIELK
jgi:glucuronoarabinoxylan endo-1,4-beta-xylanase